MAATYSISVTDEKRLPAAASSAAADMESKSTHQYALSYTPNPLWRHHLPPFSLISDCPLSLPLYKFQMVDLMPLYKQPTLCVIQNFGKIQAFQHIFFENSKRNSSTLDFSLLKLSSMNPVTALVIKGDSMKGGRHSSEALGSTVFPDVTHLVVENDNTIVTCVQFPKLKELSVTGGMISIIGVFRTLHKITLKETVFDTRIGCYVPLLQNFSCNRVRGMNEIFFSTEVFPYLKSIILFDWSKEERDTNSTYIPRFPAMIVGYPIFFSIAPRQEILD